MYCLRDLRYNVLIFSIMSLMDGPHKLFKFDPMKKCKKVEHIVHMLANNFPSIKLLESIKI